MGDRQEAKERSLGVTKLAEVHYVAKARKPNAAVQPGQEYWWIEHRYFPRQYFDHYPSRAERAQSEFWRLVFTLEDDFEWDPNSDLPEQQLMFCQRINEIIETVRTEQKKMPLHLIGSWKDELLGVRIKDLAAWRERMWQTATEVPSDLTEEARGIAITQLIEKLENITYQGQ